MSDEQEYGVFIRTASAVAVITVLVVIPIAVIVPLITRKKK